MSQSTLQSDTLDDLLSDFFKSRMRHPWPAPPAPVFAAPARQPERRPTPVVADQGSRARLTLAASIAFLLGTCWYLTSGWQTPDRAATKPGQTGGPNVLPDSTAQTPGAFDKNRKDAATKTKDPMAGFHSGPITLP